VEDLWRVLELIVIPHKDSKDVFILGGTDDIQVSNQRRRNNLNFESSIFIFSKLFD